MLITQESLHTTYKMGRHSHLYESSCIITFHHHHLPPSSPSTIITFHHHLTPTLTTRDTFEMEIAIKNDASLPDSFDCKRDLVALEPDLDSGSTTDEAVSKRSSTGAYV
jgi:hypothetical protein